MSRPRDTLEDIQNMFFQPRVVSFSEFEGHVGRVSANPPQYHTSIVTALDEMKQQLEATEQHLMVLHRQWSQERAYALRLRQQIAVMTMTTPPPPPPSAAGPSPSTGQTCCICLELILERDITFLPCACGFHVNCIDRWHSDKRDWEKKCPHCQHPVHEMHNGHFSSSSR
jgi:hypothetical protein